MHLYHLTLQRATAVTSVAYGSFTGPRTHELVLARGSSLELMRVDDTTGHLSTLNMTDAFGLIRVVLPFRLIGQSIDYLAVTSDSGRLTVLEWSKAASGWARAYGDAFGKSGVRRGIPGQIMARDPAGRAILVAAPEKAKFIFTVSRDGTNALVISSPLEAHRTRTLCFDAVGLDVGFENPTFACLEVEAPDADPDAPRGSGAPIKVLATYELDLGVNVVVRKWARETDRGANALLALPGGDEGPGGVLVFCENWVLFESPSVSEALRTPLPRRTDQPDERSVLIVAHALHKSRSGFFALAQSERGDLYRIEVVLDANRSVIDILVRYFDTIELASHLAITRSGLLFAASDSGDHALYQFLALGDAPTPSAPQAHALRAETAEGTVEVHVPVFAPRPLVNLMRLDSAMGLHTLCETRIVPSSVSGGAEASASIAALCGRGALSTLRLLSEGLSVTESAVSPLPAAPLAVFTLKASSSTVEAAVEVGGSKVSVPDARIVLSFADATVVLGVGESVEELPTELTGFDAIASTLASTVLPDGSHIQVTAGAMRMIGVGVGGAKGTVRAWTPPGRKRIVRAAVNGRQVVLALSGGDIKVFEYDAASRTPVERASKSVGAEVLALAMPPVGEGRLRSPLVVVADANNLVRVLWLEPERALEQAASQALRSPASSLAVLAAPAAASTALLLYVGLTNGVMTRLSLDAGSGALSDARVRFLGTRAVQLVPIRAGGSTALLALSSRSWVAYSTDGRAILAPLCYAPIEAAAAFSTDALPEAFVAVVGASLRILSLDRLGASGFTAATLALGRTPRRLVTHSTSGCAVILCTDHDALSESAVAAVTSTAAAIHPTETAAAAAAQVTTADDTSATIPSAADDLLRHGYAPPSSESGCWASSVKLVNLGAVGGRNVDSGSPSPLNSSVELLADEAALCVAVVKFTDHGTEEFVIVGTATGMTLHPRRARTTALRTYRVCAIDDGGEAAMDIGIESTDALPLPGARWRLELEHITILEDAIIPGAMIPFNGRLLVGVGSTLRLYDMGRKKLLRKCEIHGMPTFVTCLASSLDRVFIGDAAESVTVVRYRRAENAFVAFADDTSARWCTSLIVVDHDTIAVGDRFGTISLLRVPEGANDDAGEAPTSSRMSGVGERIALNGAPFKLLTVAQFYCGGSITSISRGVLSEGGADVLLYSTSTGALGALMPLMSKDLSDFFMHLEMYLRASEGVSVIGRDHLAWRSYFSPVVVSFWKLGSVH